jgi:hypothetical protein
MTEHDSAECTARFFQDSVEYTARIFNDPIAKKLREFDLEPKVADDRLMAVMSRFPARIGAALLRRLQRGEFRALGMIDRDTTA